MALDRISTLDSRGVFSIHPAAFLWLILRVALSSRARARCSCRPAGKIQNREIPSFQRMPHPCPLTEESVPAMAGTRPFAMTDWHWRQCRTILRRANSEGDRREDGMKRSASVSLTVVAAVSMAARGQQRLDPCAGRKLPRAGLPGSDSEPRVLLEWAMGSAQVSLSLPLLLRCLSGLRSEWGRGERSRCRILRSSCSRGFWNSRCSARGVRSDWRLPWSA
jgi:hypothetical protein